MGSDLKSFGKSNLTWIPAYAGMTELKI